MANDSQIPPGALTRRGTPETFRARDLTVSLAASDIEESLAWYGDVLAFHVEEKHEEDGELRGVTLLAGTVRIRIRQDEGAEGADARERQKGEGFSMHLTTDEDIDELARRIEERGGDLEEGPVDVAGGVAGGGRVLRVRDPDGFRLVISGSITES